MPKHVSSRLAAQIMKQVVRVVIHVAAELPAREHVDCRPIFVGLAVAFLDPLRPNMFPQIVLALGIPAPKNEPFVVARPHFSCRPPSLFLTGTRSRALVARGHFLFLSPELSIFVALWGVHLLFWFCTSRFSIPCRLRRQSPKIGLFTRRLEFCSVGYDGRPCRPLPPL